MSGGRLARRVFPVLVAVVVVVGFVLVGLIAYVNSGPSSGASELGVFTEDEVLTLIACEPIRQVNLSTPTEDDWVAIELNAGPPLSALPLSTSVPGYEVAGTWDPASQVELVVESIDAVSGDAITFSKFPFSEDEMGSDVRTADGQVLSLADFQQSC